MVVIVLVAAWTARIEAAYGSVLILRRDRRRWYRAKIVASFGNLTLLGVFVAFHWLNAFVAILISVCGQISVALTYYLRARRLLGVTGVPTKEKRTAIIQLTLPAVPSVFFYALSGQLSVLLITIFGRTAGVASVGALGRLGQIFGLLSQMNGILVEPYFARLKKAQLKANYLIAVTLAGCFGFCVVVLAHFFPGLFLWVLGPKYAGLRVEVMLVMLGGAMGLVGGIIATVNSSRRFTILQVRSHRQYPHPYCGGPVYLESGFEQREGSTLVRHRFRFANLRDRHSYRALRHGKGWAPDCRDRL